MSEEWTRTTCPYCGVGCGVLARPRGDGGAEIKGDPEHPANFGRLCAKGSALGETLSRDGRLLRPMVDGAETDWDAALDRVARRFAETIAAHGPDSVAFYGSGQLLIEDYYVANKLMKGFIGTANIDTNSRLCMASSVAGHRRAFGSDTVPGSYRDLEEADLVVLAGSNLAWCHPVLFQRLLAARETRGTTIVAIDPRATATTAAADLHLAIAPGADVALFSGLLAHLAETGGVDLRFIAAHTVGFEPALAEARAFDLAAAARTTELAPEALTAFYDLFARTERVVTVYSQGVNQSSAGTDKVNAILNCHLATGRIGRPGMGPFSVTGQPNAMGGREVGGLANMLAAHMDIDNPEHRGIVQAFWGSPTIAAKPGLKAVDLFRAVEDGRVKALWIMATNPVDSMPEANRVREAIRNCPFVVVSDVCATDTTALADVLLPSAAWGEKDGTVTNSERRMSRQRAFLAPPGEALPDWRQVAEVAARLGFGDAFAHRSPAGILGEYARLTATRNGGRRDLDLGALAGISDAEYDALTPFQWPRRAGEAPAETRFFANGGFYHADRKARFVSTPFRVPAARTSVGFPFILNTGRIRDQWHTMTRTAKTPRLTGHIGEPFVEIHPADAEALGVKPADLAEIESAHGRAILRVVVTERQRPGSLFAPMHWTDQFASQGRIDAVTSSAVDPVSGQPELKITAVSAKRFQAAWYAFAVSRAPFETDGADYFARAPARGGWRAELAGLEEPADWTAFARKALALGEAIEIVAYHDAAAGQRRFVAFAAATFAGAFFVAREPVAAARAWLGERLGERIATEERLRLLAGRPGADVRDRGATVCACFDVGRNEILEAAAQGCATVAAVGARLEAGTNCGSCRGEIARLVGAEANAPRPGGGLRKAL
ncbi:assimilatory nitrate reductase (NADH) alpha subunit apoprotein [Roseiarcus fermentans]|uniref:Assimilatory nitrate reductase (NADH) alpha subunit apoprotein n=1 Tax=Roseiarcus fermentans TaxID=1473586 RepID=A0A366EHQ1_9HYPH|nr:nitrate reductase [Roseiarcus fermentans]RBP00955.1 assimilatory nitrate reductase (NADH) alpha subunit apoprotein [Roseiarcus fermentans]